MEDAITQVKNAIVAGRTDIINTVLENCGKFGHGGVTLREKILLENNIVPEGTFLHLGTKLGLVDVVRTFLMAGADPSIENKQGENAFELAQSEAMQQVYVEELLRAVANSDFARMDQLFKAGLDPNSWDCEEKKNSVLHWGVSFGNATTVKYLLERGADVNAETKDGVTALHDAVDRGDADIVSILLDAGASPLIKAETGKYADQSPLDLASSKPDIFSLLSHFLADQFKRKTKRSSSMDSISVFNGPESPIFTKDNHMFRSPHERTSTSGSVDYLPVHGGFNSALEGVLRNLELKAPMEPLVTDSSLSLLWPQPKSLRQLDGLHFRPEKCLYISVVKSKESVHRILDVIGTYKGELDKLGFDATAKQVEGGFDSASSFIHSSLVQCCVNPDVLPIPNSYRLHVSSQKVRITAADLQGLHYAICTFIQLLSLYTKEPESNAGIPPVIINDHPSLQHRAVFIDISQERVPTVANLCELIQSLSLVKINFLHLHLRLDKNGTLLSYTKGEIVAIDRHCEDFGMVLVPAIDIPCGVTGSDFMISIKPMLQELLPCFSSSRYVHVGPQLTTLICSQTSDNHESAFSFSVLWEYLPVSPSDSVVMLCHNAIRSRNINISTLLNLPSNVILVEYGFQADYNFGPSIQELTQNGCGTSVCVGTSAWSSLAGCPEASLCNIYHGTMVAVNNSSLGLIVANWSGSCNFTPRVFALPGFLLAAGLAWNHQTHWEYLQGSLASLLSTYLLKDKSGFVGQVILQLGCTESNVLRTSLNQSITSVANLPPLEGTTLYRLLTDPDTVPLEYLTVESLIKCIRSVKKCQTILVTESKLRIENTAVYDELCLTMEMMLLSCKTARSLLAAGINPNSNMGLTVVNLGISNLAPTIRTDIANKLLILTEEYRRVWLLQSYPQGLETSLHTLTTVLQRFIPDSTRLLTGRLVTSTGSFHGTNGYADGDA